MTPQDATERVARGATMLDEKRPGWADEIDVTRLNIVSGCNCILGQIYGTWNSAPFPYEMCLASGGFMADFWGVESELLRNAWIIAINARLAPKIEWTKREIDEKVEA